MAKNSSAVEPFYKVGENTGDMHPSQPLNVSPKEISSPHEFITGEMGKEPKWIDEPINVDRLYNRSVVEAELLESKLSVIFDELKACSLLLQQALDTEDELTRENIMVRYYKACFKLTFLMDYSERYAQFVNIVTDLAHKQINSAYDLTQISVLKSMYEIVRQDVDLNDDNFKKISNWVRKYKLPYTNPLKDLSF